ncbi:hypothetical protein [Streptomyces sp. 7N604]|uniref:hypothetical protein n=1 Tax=Streptomyces sp. 7N604 TaxID=3457415 RepID=UPI003FD25085
MQADYVRRWLAQGLVAALLSASFIVAGPAAPKAHAVDWDDFNPCNLPGGGVACKKAEEGSKWLYENSPVKGAVETTAEVVDFATDPLGYIESKLRAGTKGMFEAFGEELTGKKPSAPKNGRKTGKTEGG